MDTQFNEEDIAAMEYLTNQQISRFSNKKTQALLIAFVCCMPTCCLILLTFWFFPSIKENQFEYYVTQIIFYFTYIMDGICYYKTITLTSQCPVKKKAPILTEIEIPQIDSIYRNNKICEKCNQFWKPTRTHHCSTCKKCISGMDHHCPWTICCIGTRNHKSFLLFNFYMLIGASIYSYFSLVYCINEYQQQTLWQHNFLFYAFWVLTNIIIYPTTFGLFMLVFFHSQMALANVTTLETMQGVPLYCQPEFPNQKRTINPFDMGPIKNIEMFFGSNFWLWWFPTEVVTYNDATSFPMIPQCSQLEIQQAFYSIQAETKNNIDIEGLSEEAQKKYFGMHLQINQKIFDPLSYKQIEIEKDKEKENLMPKQCEMKRESVDLLENSEVQQQITQ